MSSPLDSRFAPVPPEFFLPEIHPASTSVRPPSGWMPISLRNKPLEKLKHDARNSLESTRGRTAEIVFKKLFNR